MKNFLIYFIKFELIALIVIFIPLAYLFMPVQVYAQHYSDNKIVRDIQLMLTQKGIHAGENKEAIKIDGIYGPQTEAGIKEYERQNNMEETGKPSEDLRSRLYEDVKSLTNNNNTNEDKKLAALAQELNETKENLKNTNEALKTITDNMSDHFINNFNNLFTLLLSILAIVVTAFSVWLGWYIPIVQEEIANKVEQAHQNMITKTDNRVTAGVLLSISSHCINLYKDMNIIDTKNTKQIILYDSYLEIAKNISFRGYEKARSLEKIEPKLTPEDKEIINWSKNNRLFYITTPFINKNKKDIVDDTDIRNIYNELSKVYKTYTKDDSYWWYMEETLIWAEYNMGYKSTSEIEKKIHSLLADPYIPNEWKDETKERYTKHTPKYGSKLNFTL